MREIYRSAIGFNKFTTKKWFNTAAALGAAMALFAAPLGAQGDQAAKDKKKKEKTPPVEFTEEAQSSPKANPEANEGANEEEAYRAVSKGAVITASRIDTERSKTPAVVQVIDRQDIERSVSTTADELLIEAGLGHVYKLPGATSDKIAIRGVTSASMGNPWKGNVRMLVNGQPGVVANPAIFQNSLIERIEIVKGPASVVYGSGASGGVINIITKPPVSKGFSGLIGVSGGSWGLKQTELEISASNNGFFVDLGANYLARNSYETPEFDLIQNSQTNSITTRVNTGYNFSGNHQVSFSINSSHFWDIGSPNDRKSPSENDYLQQKRIEGAINYRNDNLIASLFSGQNQKTNFTKDGWTPNEYTENWQTLGGSIQNLFFVFNQELLLGGEWTKIDLESESKNGPPYNPNALSNSYGGFSELRLQHNDNLFINLGFRFDYYGLEVNPTDQYELSNETNYNFTHPSYRGGLLYKVIPDLGIKINAGTGFRAPAPNERGSYTNTTYNTFYKGNPNLKPEKIKGGDAGLEYNGKNLYVASSFFLTEYADKIVWTTENGAMTYMTPTNLSGASIQGLELSLNWVFLEIPRLNINISTNGNFTLHTKRENLDSDEVKKNGTDVLLLTPDKSATGGVLVTGKSFDLNFFGRYKGVEKYSYWNPITWETVYNDSEPFWVFSAKGVYRFKETIQAEASIDNLLDTQYSYVEGYPMPGRNFTFGVKYKFL